jgi:asparagine synthase (glutamine-hydrolysing)
LGTDHTELYVSHKDALNVLPQWPRIYDEPFADSSGIPTFLVAQLARQKVGVSLSGDGGDEMFCGYNRHVKLDAIWKRAQWIPYQLRRSFESLFHLIPVDPLEAVLRRCKYGLLSDQLQKLLAILRLKGPEQMYIRLSTFWEDPSLVIGACEIPTLLSDTRQWPELPTPLEQMLYVESMTSLPGDMLAKVDRAAMALSLETRIPFLDHRIVEFAWRLPMSMKLRCGIGKWVLRQVLYKYVPQSLIERPKSGFGVPIDQWLRGPLRSWAEDLLSESRLTRQGILNPKPIRQKWHEHISGYRKWQYHLWGVLMFEAWLDHR